MPHAMDYAPTLLLVSVEVTVKLSFWQYARRSYKMGHLERSMLDEIEPIRKRMKTTDPFRVSFAELQGKRYPYETDWGGLIDTR